MILNTLVHSLKTTCRFLNGYKSTFLPSATKLRRLCFYMCVCLSTGGGGLPQCMLGYRPREQAPPRAGSPPGAGTPQEQAPPREQAPPQNRHPPEQATPPSRRLLLRTVRILLECILVFTI